MEEKWTWARKESQDVWMNGQYSSREIAIEQAKMTAIDEGLENIYIGKCEAYLPGSPNADIVIERLGDSLCDEFPTDIVEDYILNISVDDGNLLQEKLDNAWSEWLEETDNYPNLYKIADVGEVKVYPKK
jgi:hypothetical protein